MKILTISNAAWDDRNSVGNTQSNWFDGLENTVYCSLYTREAEPNNHCCHFYYKVTIEDIIRNFFSWSRIGRAFVSYDKKYDVNQERKHEERALKIKNKWIRSLLQMIIEVIYSTKIWLNNRLKEYILDYHPDVVFCFAIAEPFRYNLIKYVKKHTNAKVVMWVADDVLAQTQRKSLLFGWNYRRRYKTLFSLADKVYGVSQMLCDEYSELLGLHIEPLYKGCSLSPSKQVVGNPIKLVYAGNLLYGRDKTLAAIAEQLKVINKVRVRAQLDIYSASTVDNSVLHKLNVEGTSRFCGVRPYEQITMIMREADIVLHVESFDEEQIRNVRLSFSTKIIDCMQSGSAMMVVGPKGIASVEYPRKIEGVMVVDDLSQLFDSLLSIVNEPYKLLHNAEKLNLFAQKYHERGNVQARLQDDFKELISI